MRCGFTRAKPWKSPGAKWVEIWQQVEKQVSERRRVRRIRVDRAQKGAGEDMGLAETRAERDTMERVDIGAR